MEVSIQILSSNQSGDVWPPGDGQGGNSPLLDGGLVKRFYRDRFHQSISGGRNFFDKRQLARVTLLPGSVEIYHHPNGLDRLRTDLTHAISNPFQVTLASRLDRQGDELCGIVRVGF